MELGVSLTKFDIACQRLVAQQIAGPRFDQARDVVRWMGALQGQDYRQALWAVGLRTGTATAATVEQAIEDREILFTWPMRGTLHVVPAEDAKWMIGLTATRQLAGDRRRQEQLGLDEAMLSRSRQLIEAALTGGKRRTRSELMRLLDDNGISTASQRGYHILYYLALREVICLGPLAGKEQTFVLLDEWVPKPRRLGREDALAELSRRYFTSHGPATLPDFARWTGLTLTESRRGLELVKNELASVTVDGEAYWQGESSPATGRADPPAAHLLPGFDEYLLGYKNRDAVLPPEHANKIVPGGNGVFKPIIVVGGDVVGTWKRAVKKQGVEITVTPFAHLAVPTETVAEAAQRYAAFLNLPLRSIQQTSE